MTELGEFTSPTKEKPLNESVESMQQAFPACFAHTIGHSDNTDVNLPCSDGTSSCILKGALKADIRKWSGYREVLKAELQFSKTAMFKQESED